VFDFPPVVTGTSLYLNAFIDLTYLSIPVNSFFLQKAAEENMSASAANQEYPEARKIWYDAAEKSAANPRLSPATLDHRNCFWIITIYYEVFVIPLILATGR